MTTVAQGIMFKFTYRTDPKHKPDEVFDVIRFFPGSDATLLKYNAQNHAMKSGAIAVTSITPEQYKELLNEKDQSQSSDAAAKEAN